MAFITSTDGPGASWSSSTVVFRDGLGERRQPTDQSRGNVELLCIRQELNDVSSFEFALRERVNRLATFRHAYFTPVRGVERINEPQDTLAIVSDVTPGVRLSELLASLEERHVTLDITAALKLIRQIVPAVAMLHESARDVAHGAIAPERLVVTPNARLVVVDYVLGSALEQLRYSHERYWTELRVALPKTGGAPRFDHRADVMQIGLVALSLILGRALRREEYPTRVRELVASAWSASGSGGGSEPLPPGLNAWLGRALQLDALTAFPSAIEARAELDKVLGEGGLGTSPAGVQTVLSKYPAGERPRAPTPNAGSSQPTGVAVLDVPAPSRGSTAPTRAVAPARDVVPGVAPRPDGAPKTSMLSALDAEPLPEPVGVYQPTSIPDLPPVSARSPVALPSLAPEPKPKSPKLSVLDLKPLAEPIGRAGTVDLDQVSLVAPSSPHDSRPITLPPLAAPEAPKVPKLAALDRKPLADPTPIAPYSLRSFESTVVQDTGIEKPKGFRLWKWVGGAAIVLPALVGGGALTAKRMGAKPTVVAVGTLVMTTNPAGVQALVDGQPRGTTPLTVELPEGPHTIELVGAGTPKTVPVTITAGMQTAQYIDLPADTGAPAPPHEEPTPGRSDASQDAAKQGAATGAGVPAALTAGAPAPVEPATPPPGWLSVSGPLVVQVFEKGRPIGSGKERISLTAGKHDVELVNDDLGYRVSRSIDVQPGKAVTVQQEIPKAAVALNALPWAEVWIDGEKVGETPIGNLSLPIGTHDLVFKHPDLGERRQTLVVSLKNPARVSVDLRQK